MTENATNTYDLLLSQLEALTSSDQESARMAAAYEIAAVFSNTDILDEIVLQTEGVEDRDNLLEKFKGDLLSRIRAISDQAGMSKVDSMTNFVDTHQDLTIDGIAEDVNNSDYYTALLDLLKEIMSQGDTTVFGEDAREASTSSENFAIPLPEMHTEDIELPRPNRDVVTGLAIQLDENRDPNQYRVFLRVTTSEGEEEYMYITVSATETPDSFELGDIQNAQTGELIPLEDATRLVHARPNFLRNIESIIWENDHIYERVALDEQFQMATVPVLPPEGGSMERSVENEAIASEYFSKTLYGKYALVQGERIGPFRLGQTYFVKGITNYSQEKDSDGDYVGYFVAKNQESESLGKEVKVRIVYSTGNAYLVHSKDDIEYLADFEVFDATANGENAEETPEDTTPLEERIDYIYSREAVFLFANLLVPSNDKSTGSKRDRYCGYLSIMMAQENFQDELEGLYNESLGLLNDTNQKVKYLLIEMLSKKSAAYSRVRAIFIENKLAQICANIDIFFDDDNKAEQVHGKVIGSEGLTRKISVNPTDERAEVEVFSFQDMMQYPEGADMSQEYLEINNGYIGTEVTLPTPYENTIKLVDPKTGKVLTDKIYGKDFELTGMPGAPMIVLLGKDNLASIGVLFELQGTAMYVDPEYGEFSGNRRYKGYMNIEVEGVGENLFETRVEKAIETNQEYVIGALENRHPAIVALLQEYRDDIAAIYGRTPEPGNKELEAFVGRVLLHQDSDETPPVMQEIIRTYLISLRSKCPDENSLIAVLTEVTKDTTLLVSSEAARTELYAQLRRLRQDVGPDRTNETGVEFGMDPDRRSTTILSAERTIVGGGMFRQGKEEIREVSRDVKFGSESKGSVNKTDQNGFIQVETYHANTVLNGLGAGGAIEKEVTTPGGSKYKIQMKLDFNHPQDVDIIVGIREIGADGKEGELSTFKSGSKINEPLFGLRQYVHQHFVYPTDKKQGPDIDLRNNIELLVEEEVSKQLLKVMGSPMGTITHPISGQTVLGRIRVDEEEGVVIDCAPIIRGNPSHIGERSPLELADNLPCTQQAVKSESQATMNVFLAIEREIIDSAQLGFKTQLLYNEGGDVHRRLMNSELYASSDRLLAESDFHLSLLESQRNAQREGVEPKHAGLSVRVLAEGGDNNPSHWFEYRSEGYDGKGGKGPDKLVRGGPNGEMGAYDNFLEYYLHAGMSGHARGPTEVPQMTKNFANQLGREYAAYGSDMYGFRHPLTGEYYAVRWDPNAQELKIFLVKGQPSVPNQNRDNKLPTNVQLVKDDNINASIENIFWSCPALYNMLLCLAFQQLNLNPAQKIEAQQRVANENKEFFDGLKSDIEKGTQIKNNVTTRGKRIGKMLS